MLSADRPLSGTKLMRNEAVHFAPGACPACGVMVNLVASPGERVVRWACGGCKTVGMAPWMDGALQQAELQRFASA